MWNRDANSSDMRCVDIKLQVNIRINLKEMDFKDKDLILMTAYGGSCERSF
jgi:hypothetical protein